MSATNLINQWPLLMLPLLLCGCGVTQRATDNTTSVATSIFYAQVNTLRLDFTAREALNIDQRESSSLSEPVMVRVYQLKDRKRFDNAVYEQLVSGGEGILGSDLLATRDVVVKPGGDASLDMPLNEHAQFVAVAGLFRQPDLVRHQWKLVLTREELDPDVPRIIEPGNHALTLLQEVK